MSQDQRTPHWSDAERERLKRRNLITAGVILAIVAAFITVSITVSFLNASPA